MGKSEKKDYNIIEIEIDAIVSCQGHTIDRPEQRRNWSAGSSDPVSK